MFPKREEVKNQKERGRMGSLQIFLVICSLNFGRVPDTSLKFDFFKDTDISNIKLGEL